MKRLKLRKYCFTGFGLFVLLLALLPSPMAERLGELYLQLLIWVTVVGIGFGAAAYLLVFLRSAARR